MIITLKDLIAIPMAVRIFAFFMQVYKNYRLKSTAAISPWMIYTFIAGGLAVVPYNLILVSPWPYRFGVPLLISTGFIQLFQSLLYSEQRSLPKILLWLYPLTVFFIGIWVWFAVYNPIYNEALGWFSAALFFVYMLPQMYHTWQRKSTKGLSLSWLILEEIITAFQLYLSYALSLPAVFLFNQSRRLLFISAILVQYFYYWRHER